MCTHRRAMTFEVLVIPQRFCGQLADYYSHFFSFIHPLQSNEFSFKEMRVGSVQDFILLSLFMV